MANRKSLVAVLLFAFAALGFDLSNSAVPREEIQDGGVPVDGIPALTDPDFVSGEEADDFLEAEDAVVGLVEGENAKAYPFRILNWHEVVNDSFAGNPVTITYCPLTGSARVFEGSLQGKRVRFGVSGKLYKSNFLLYDRETRSLWSQIRGEALAGPLRGTLLRPLPARVARWKAWKAIYPDTKVLSLNTGFLRDYSRDPYRVYSRSEAPMFPVGKIREEFPPKAWVIGVRVDGRSKAYAVETLKRRGVIKDQIGGEKMIVEWLPELEEFRVRDREGREQAVVRLYWFAWQAVFPETEVYST